MSHYPQIITSVQLIGQFPIITYIRDKQPNHCLQSGHTYPSHIKALPALSALNCLGWLHLAAQKISRCCVSGSTNQD